MTDDFATLRTRQWAVPFLNTLFVLHHDFYEPRYVEVQQLRWTADDVKATCRYGFYEANGEVGRTALFDITAERNGKIDVALVSDDEEAPFTDFPAYLVDELSVLTGNTAHLFQEWKRGDTLDEATAERFRLICWLLVHPASDLQVTLTKAEGNLASVLKISFADGTIHYELSCYPPAGVVASWTYPSAPTAATFDYRRCDDIRCEL